MDKIIIKWDIGMLNKLIGMTYKKSQTITIFNLRNVQKLLNTCDFSMYQNKSMIIKRVEFLRKSLEAKLDQKFADDSIIINYAVDDVDDPTLNDIVNNLPKYKQLNHNEIKYLNKFVEDRLRYGTIQYHLTQMRDIIEKIENGEFSTYSEAYLLLDNWVKNFKLDSRRISSELRNGVLRFNDDRFIERIDDILAKLGTTQSIIVTGCKMLNAILAPGYRGGKLYCYAALPANFKSGMLLKTAIDTIRYNAKTYKGKKDDHKKAVVYFTMENTIEETFERTYNMVCNKDEIIDHDSKYIYAEMKRSEIVGNENMELIMVYKPNRSIDTNDIRMFIEELDEEGIEVVLLCFDYIKRIKSYERAKDEKEELKNVTNELRQIGVDFDIPIVSAAQLNRQAAAVINAAVRSGKGDALKDIDASMIGSAFEILENSDLVILINIQKRKKDGKLFLQFLCSKNRYKETDLKFFNQPFSEVTFDLEDDILCDKPKGVISIATDFEDVDMDLYKARGRKVHITDDDNQVVGSTDLFALSPLS